jgi:CRISPR-associated protein Cas1
MFARRFRDIDVHDKSIEELRGMEGKRVKALYAEMGSHFGVTWKGRNYNPTNWQLADNLNRSVSTANAALYALCMAVTR